MAICETWIGDSVPDSVKFGLASESFSIAHVHHLLIPGRPTYSGPSLLTTTSLFHDHKLQATTHLKLFECQLINIWVANQVITVTNIYRPQSSSKSTFLSEFDDLLSSLCLHTGNHLLFCDNFNPPGQSDWLVDKDLMAILTRFGIEQHVKELTHYAASSNHRNILDLVLNPNSLMLVKTTSVMILHHLSNHQIVMWSCQWQA